jgi:hypothetical protein
MSVDCPRPENGNNQQQFSVLCLVSQTQPHSKLRQIGELAQIGQRRQLIVVDLNDHLAN